ncbi:hypothetical protein Q5752_003727 [Cryptotrichosporon argae]
MDRFAELPPIDARFAARANEHIPVVRETAQRPRGLVRVTQDEGAALGWTVEDAGAVEDMHVLDAGDSVIVDFGGHRNGYLSFDLVPYKHGIEPNDSPCRLRLVFGEVVNDVAEAFEPYSAFISAAWLPDEILTVDFLPQPVRITRRHAFRFVKVEVLATSRNYGVRVENPMATAISSAPADPPALTFAAAGADLPEEDKDLLRRIDAAALLTLRNCMTTVYEDGPRRDMRLWIGDLRLQALTNYATFNEHALARRCLFLFAAAPFSRSGLLSASIFEHPTLCSGGQAIVDYAHLYAAALRDYVRASNDVATGHELFETAERQLVLGLGRCDAHALYAAEITDPSADAKDKPPADETLWHFIDWQDKLDKRAPSHCVLIYGLRALLDLSALLSLPVPSLAVPFAPAPLALPAIIDALTCTAREAFFDEPTGAFLSGTARQLSWATNAWAVLAGVPTSRAQAARAMTVAYESADAVIATTPYLHHHLVDALIDAGLDGLALAHIKRYWGSMLDAGAATFWEAWDPDRPRFSPYGDLHSNSFCHAWSCTPSLLLRRLGFA